MLKIDVSVIFDFTLVILIIQKSNQIKWLSKKVISRPNVQHIFVQKVVSVFLTKMQKLLQWQMGQFDTKAKMLKSTLAE